MYKILLWDLDDTLWDFRVNGRIALQEVFKEFELIKYFDSFESFYNVYEPKNQELWDRYSKGEITKKYLRQERFSYPLRQVGKNDDCTAQKMEDEFLLRTTSKTRLVEGAIEILEYCRNRYKMSIISNGFYEVQYKKVANSGLLSYFDKIFLSDDIGYQKPDIRFFNKVVEMLEADKKDCIVIGDNKNTDIDGALNAGIDAIYFDRDKTKLELPKERIIRVEKLFEIRHIL